MSDDETPRPFRRERNLSNRNFRRRASNKRISNESHSSVETASESASASNSCHDTSATNSTASDSLHISYSVSSDSESAFSRKSQQKMQPPEHSDDPDAKPPTPDDPAWLDVKQKVKHFETLQEEDRIIFKTSKHGSKFADYNMNNNNNNNNNNKNYFGGTPLAPFRVFPGGVRNGDASSTPTTPSLQTSIDEERFEDDVDEFSDYSEPGAEYEVPEEAQEVKENMMPSPETDAPGSPLDAGITTNACEFTIDDFGKVESVRRNGAESAPILNTQLKIFGHSSEKLTAEGDAVRKGARDFPRNYRSTPRPKTEIIGTTNRHVKHNSLYHPDDEEEEEEIELRDKCDKFIHPILEELIKTEETYVENLTIGITNYGNIFHRKDLPAGLRGKKYVLLGNIEQLVEFHRDEFLPMLYRNRRDLKRLFDEFQLFIDQNCFYGYVIFTMNKKRSLKLCDVYKNYFKVIQAELDDKLGINSFLVQPIQRMARYPLLLQQFITTLFKNRDYVMKPLIESCCRLEKKVRTLLTTTNESEIINDIVDCNEFNVFYQGKFRKVSEFSVYDHTLKRNYRSKVFIFDKCIIYTEIKGKQLVFHGRYPCEHIGISAKTKSFTLFYEKRRQQECDFGGDPILIETWLELIRDMINSYVTEERVKLQERYSRENDHMHRKPLSLSLYRDSNRFSSDSGIGNIWVMPKPEMDVEATVTPSPRTTWYAAT